MGTLRYRARLEALRRWTYENCCAGRSMKTPVPSKGDYEVEWSEPKCFLGNYPFLSGSKEDYKVAPSILILASGGQAATDTEQYLDSRSGIHRAEDIGATLTLQLIHAIYEPGERTGVRMENGKADPKEAFLRNDEADEGMLLLIDWMDDTMASLIGAESIPESDLIVNTKTVGFELLKENGALADRRPFYLGYVTATFSSYSRRIQNELIDDLLN